MAGSGPEVASEQAASMVGKCHSRAVPSSLAEARIALSGLKATPITPPVWPVSGSPRG